MVSSPFFVCGGPFGGLKIPLGKNSKLEKNGNYYIMQGWKNFPEMVIFTRTLFYYKGEINMYNSNYYQPIQGTPNRQILGLKGRPVSSIEEARASSIDFDGTVFYFPDIANKRIYTKQINMDGTASLLMYELKEIPVATQPNFITRDEFDKVIEELKNSLVTPQQNSPTTPKTEYKF